MGYVSRGSTLPEPELDCWFFRRKGLQLKSGGSGARGVASAGGGCRIAYSRRVRASDELRVPIGCRTPGAEGLFSIAGRSADPECAGVAGVAGATHRRCCRRRACWRNRHSEDGRQCLHPLAVLHTKGLKHFDIAFQHVDAVQ